MTTQQTITVPLFGGVLELDDGIGSLVVLMRPDVVGSGAGLADITEQGGWRSYRAALGAR